MAEIEEAKAEGSFFLAFLRGAAEEVSEGSRFESEEPASSLSSSKPEAPSEVESPVADSEPGSELALEADEKWASLADAVVLEVRIVALAGTVGAEAEGDVELEEEEESSLS